MSTELKPYTVIVEGNPKDETIRGPIMYHVESTSPKDAVDAAFAAEEALRPIDESEGEDERPDNGGRRAGALVFNGYLKHA